MIDIHDHSFEIFTYVSEIHGNVTLVFGIENIFELEFTRVLFQCFEQIDYFLSKRTNSFETRRIEINKKEAQFVDEISGFAIVKILERKVQNTMMLNLHEIYQY